MSRLSAALIGAPILAFAPAGPIDNLDPAVDDDTANHLSPAAELYRSGSSNRALVAPR